MGESYYKYTVAKYVPDLVRGESINIGVVLHGEGFSDARFTTDLRRLSGLGFPPDPSLLRLVTSGIKKWARTDKRFDPETIWREFGRNIQFTQPRVTSTDDPEAELDELFETLVAVPGRVKRHAITRERVKRNLELSIVRRPVVNYLRRDFPASEIIKRYDEFAFDWGTLDKRGYFIHALSFDTEHEDYQLDLAKVFALTCEEVSRNIKSASFTTIVQPPTEGPLRAFESAKTIFAERNIAVVAPPHIDAFVNKIEAELAA